ncbi:hypothetical protein GCM10010439_23200 [Actinocorallia aurantiaca]|uniref:Uncharacterized protein n=1 Tax=Actinocorallia aurantiaca TaxID=46204 RepID=A0ABN3U571_9ACTN
MPRKAESVRSLDARRSLLFLALLPGLYVQYLQVSAAIEWLRSDRPEEIYIGLASLLELNRGFNLLALVPASRRPASRHVRIATDRPGLRVPRRGRARGPWDGADRLDGPVHHPGTT